MENEEAPKSQNIDLRDPETQRAYQDSQKKFTGEDVPAMHLRDRLFLQDLATAASREAEKDRGYYTQPTLLGRSYCDLARAARTVEAFLAQRELNDQDQKSKIPIYSGKEVTSGD